jgi:hypothetical protein
MTSHGYKQNESQEQTWEQKPSKEVTIIKSIFV